MTHFGGFQTQAEGERKWGLGRLSFTPDAANSPAASRCPAAARGGSLPDPPNAEADGGRVPRSGLPAPGNASRTPNWPPSGSPVHYLFEIGADSVTKVSLGTLSGGLEPDSRACSRRGRNRPRAYNHSVIRWLRVSDANGRRSVPKLTFVTELAPISKRRLRGAPMTERGSLSHASFGNWQLELAWPCRDSSIVNPPVSRNFLREPVCAGNPPS